MYAVSHFSSFAQIAPDTVNNLPVIPIVIASTVIFIIIAIALVVTVTALIIAKRKSGELRNAKQCMLNTHTHTPYSYYQVCNYM